MWNKLFGNGLIACGAVYLLGLVAIGGAIGSYAGYLPPPVTAEEKLQMSLVIGIGLYAAIPTLLFHAYCLLKQHRNPGR